MDKRLTNVSEYLRVLVKIFVLGIYTVFRDATVRVETTNQLMRFYIRLGTGYKNAFVAPEDFLKHLIKIPYRLLGYICPVSPSRFRGDGGMQYRHTYKDGILHTGRWVQRNIGHRAHSTKKWCLANTAIPQGWTGRAYALATNFIINVLIVRCGLR